MNLNKSFFNKTQTVLLWRKNDLMSECKSAKSPTHYPSITTSITVSYYTFSV